VIVRGSIISGLLIAFLLLARSCFIAWQTGQIPVSPDVDSSGKPTAVVSQEKIDFYPPPPTTMPDLHKSYLFNEQRELDPTSTATEGNDSFKLSDVTYSGSIIIGEEKKALISFSASAKDQPKEQPRRRGQVASRAAVKNVTHQQLVVGEQFNGYEVMEILPERIVFAKNGETIERPLFDPAKQRVTELPAHKKSPPPAEKGGAVEGTGPGEGAGAQTRPPAAGIQAPTPPAAGGENPENTGNGKLKPAPTSLRIRRPPLSSETGEAERPQSTDNPVPAGLRIPMGDNRLP